MKSIRINAQGHIMSLRDGIYTILAPRAAPLALFGMTQRQLVNLIQVVAAVTSLPILHSIYV